MPAGDKSGPLGQGPRTGRGKGFCSGNSAPGYANEENRRGAGRIQGGNGNAPGRGKGRRNGGGLGRGRF
ncbi:MAG: DUF5320 domain-containing protein [Bacteroidota bacterium]